MVAIALLSIFGAEPAEEFDLSGAWKLSLLSELPIGTTGVVESLDLPGEIQHHLMHMGFVPEARVMVVRRAPAGDPAGYSVAGFEVDLRGAAAGHGKDDWGSRLREAMSDCCSTATIDVPIEPRVAGKIRTVALVGPPNSGKSTLFNRLTGLRQKVANYPGVTVEQRVGRLNGIGRGDLTLIDLPGIYGLDSYSEDARVAVEVLHGEMPGTPAPDAILLVLDSLQLRRQLMLAAPVLALGLPTLLLLNMSDLMEARGGRVDTLALAQELGVPVAKISATRGAGLDAITHFLNRKAEPEQPAVAAGSKIELPVMGNPRSYRQWATGISTRTKYKAPISNEWTKRIDGVLLHKVWGPLIFLVVVFAVFQVVFSIGQPLSDGFGEVLNGAGGRIGALIGHNWVESLLIDGVWRGVASVLVFLPQILLLFLFIGVLEDSGYLARAALIADRVMRSIGLNGKAFIPLLSAYACAIPAIMATRTIENKRDRFATILVAPFMTCSARLPIYLLMIAAFIPNKPIIGGFFGLRAAV